MVTAPVAYTVTAFLVRCEPHCRTDGPRFRAEKSVSWPHVFNAVWLHSTTNI